MHVRVGGAIELDDNRLLRAGPRVWTAFLEKAREQCKLLDKPLEALRHEPAKAHGLAAEKMVAIACCHLDMALNR